MNVIKLLLRVHLGGAVFGVFLAIVLMAFNDLTGTQVYTFGEVVFLLLGVQVFMFLAFVFMWGEV